MERNALREFDIMNKIKNTAIASLALVFSLNTTSAAFAHHPEEVADIADQALPFTVTINIKKEDSRLTTASGFVIDGKQGYIVTNEHVVNAPPKSITVIFNGSHKTSYDAQFVGADKLTDIAVIKIQPEKELPSASFGDSDGLRIGQKVLTIGNFNNLPGTLTSGYISGLHRDISTSPYNDYIQTDALIGPGSSGGPLIDFHGKVIGMIYGSMGAPEGQPGIGFAIPVNQVKKHAETIIEHGSISRSFFGATYTDLSEVPENVLEASILKHKNGTVITQIDPTSPAGKAGFKPGDMIIKFGDQKIDQRLDLLEALENNAANTNVDVTILRYAPEKGEMETITSSVTLGNYDAAVQRWQKNLEQKLVPGS